MSGNDELRSLAQELRSEAIELMRKGFVEEHDALGRLSDRLRERADRLDALADGEQ